MIVKEWCSFCGECAGVCPRNLIQVREYALVFNEDDCKDCEHSNTCKGGLKCLTYALYKDLNHKDVGCNL